jgi:hypothetical protein
VVLVLIVTVATLFVVSFRSRRSVPEEKTVDLKKRLDQLRSVPYTSITRDTVDVRVSGVTTYKRGKAYDGYNIYCSRTSPEVYLMDMDGERVHTWSFTQRRTRLWNHAVMLADGSVLVISKYRSILKLDWDSNLIWEKRLRAHHEITMLPDGSFYAIEHSMEDYRDLNVRFPSIVLLNGKGQEIERWSTYDHLADIKQAFDQRSFLDTVLDELAAGDSLGIRDDIPGSVSVARMGTELVYDYFHMNTISILPETPLSGQSKVFRPGNLLICFRNVNQIAILDADTKEILWVWGEGELEWPHLPTMVENGNILIFDNGVLREYTRILELNPMTEEIVWEYVADPPGSFYSPTKGSAQRLPNGNTFVCDADNGRAFEVTRDGEIVWEWLNPATKSNHRVQIYRMMRLPPAAVDPLLGGT